MQLFGSQNTYTVTYNLNGASGTAPSSSCTVQEPNSDCSVTLPEQGDLLKTGYTSSGWNTGADGRGTDYSAGSSLTLTGNITLYPKWAPSTYVVAVNIADSDNEPSCETISVVFNARAPDLNCAVAPTKIGHHLEGWKLTGTSTKLFGADGRILTDVDG